MVGAHLGRIPTLRFSASPPQELNLPRANHKAREGLGQAGPRSTSTAITLISPTDLASMLPINLNIKIKVFLFQSSSHAARLQVSISASLKELLNPSSWDLQKQQLSSVASPLSSPSKFSAFRKHCLHLRLVFYTLPHKHHRNEESGPRTAHQRLARPAQGAVSIFIICVNPGPRLRDAACFK